MFRSGKESREDREKGRFINENRDKDVSGKSGAFFHLERSDSWEARDGAREPW
jgi:hypothetical protein